MWIEQLQSGINIAIVFIAGTALTALFKIYLEKVVFMRKLFDFLGNFIPFIAFFMAASSKEVCHILGFLLGVTETVAFYFLLVMGFMFASNTIIFFWEISRDSAINQKKAKDTTDKPSN